MRGNGSRCRESAGAAGSTGEMRGNDARRCGSADADGSTGEMPENDARRRGSAVAAGSTGEMRGNGARRHGSADAGGSAGELPENDARRRGGTDADRSPGRLRRSNARHGEGKEAKRAPEASREEERRRDVQAGVYGSPEPRRGHECRRRMALGGWRSPEQGGEESEDDRDRRRAQRSPARQRTEEWEARVKGSECSSQYSTGADARARREEIEEYPYAGAGLVQEPVGEARGRHEREINRRRGEEERCRREVSPGEDPGSDKARGREDHGRRGAGGRGRRWEGESLERKEGREKTRGSNEELREEKEHEYSEEEDYGYNLERRRRGKPDRREKKSCPEEREGCRGRRGGRRKPGAGMREKQDLSGQGKRGDKQHMRQEGMHEYETESGEEEESDRRARHGSGQREESWEGYVPGRREGLRSRQEERREFREREDRQQRERRKQEGRCQEYSPEKRERRWGEAGGQREAYEEERRRSPSPKPQEEDEKVGAGADEPVAAGAEGKDEKVGAWAAAEGEEKDEKKGVGACVTAAAKAEEKEEQVGAGACVTAAAKAEEKEEQVGAGACVTAAAKAEEKEEQVGAGVCVTAAAKAEEKEEQVGAGACVTAAAKAEEKEEQVGAGVCVTAAAKAEEKEEQVGAGACVTAAAKAEEKEEQVGAGACVTAAAKAEEKEEQVGAGACVTAAAKAEWKDEKVGARSCELKAEKQVQGSMMTNRHVRKLREEHSQLLGEKMVKEAARRTKTGVRSMKVEMACDWGQGDLRVGGWEGSVWDKAQEQEEAESESKEMGAWECPPAGEEVGHTMGVAALKTFAALGNPSSPPFNAWTGDDPCGGEAGSAWAGIKCDTGSPYNSVTEIDIQDANLSGDLPPSIFDLTSLRLLNLALNPNLTGSFPDALGNLLQLTTLDMHGCRLSGSIPSTIGRLTSLSYFLVNQNRLSGSLPAQIGTLPQLYMLDVMENQLEGPLPTFEGANELGHLDLSSNSFTGAIPGTLFEQHPNLVNLNLANNALDSSLPPEITTAAKLQSVFLSGNQLSGPLPDLSSLPSIVSLSLFDNSLSSLPPALLIETNITLQLFNNDLCKPFKPDYTQVCSPPTPLTQYTAPAFCDGLACENDLYSPSAPLYNESLSCVCVSPLRADLELFISDFVVYHEALVAQLEQRIFSELASKSQINISRPQLLISAISSPASLYSLASTFASDHADHESTLIITLLFFPPGGDNSWYPRDTPQAICNALTSRDLAVRVALGNFGLFRVAGFYGPAPYNSPSQQQPSSGLSTGAIVAISVCCAAVAIALIVALLMRPWEKRRWNRADYEALEGITLQHARRYSLRQLAEATNGFDDSLVLGTGGYGKVYHGILNGESVAIKKATEKHRHAGVDFKNEIEMLTAVSHGNLVKLTGFCVEKDEQLLVFEFMEGGALDAWIKGKTGRVLSWKERMRIALDAASALHYLHKEMRPSIVHRDIKPANILLTASLEAKVADFGISKSLPERGELVQEEIIGSKGYIDPHFAVSEVLTERSDVFSFGVVLLQLATGQPPVIQGVPLSQVVLHLAFGQDGLPAAIDPKLSDLLQATAAATAAAAAAASNGASFHSASAAAVAVVSSAAGGEVSAGEMVEGLEETFGTFLRVALWCTAEHPSLRPDMEQVVSALRSIRDHLRALPGGGTPVGPVRAVPSGTSGYGAADVSLASRASGYGSAALSFASRTSSAVAGTYSSATRSPESGVTGGVASLSTLWSHLPVSTSQPGSNWSNFKVEQGGMGGYDDTGTHRQTLTGPYAR
ncbi:unnamed protein product [Closterium sp. Naga37s-1]|nr:unnamed protein product [Closterium sp. Naga37s-1]